MDFFLLGIGLVMMTWIWALVWVQHDVKGMPEEIKRANADVLLLPFLGFLMYLIDRQRRKRATASPHSLMGRVAGLKADEAPKKRGLFGGRTKITTKPGRQETTSGDRISYIGR